METRLLSSLVKVFADEELKAQSWRKGSMLKNEVFSFQVAYTCRERIRGALKKINVKVESYLAPWIAVREVGLVPSQLPCYPDHDEYILRSAPGLYPDILIPLQNNNITLFPGQWRSIWVTIDPCSQVEAGKYEVGIVFESLSGEELAREIYEIEIIKAELPRQKLKYTEWFHTDCLATWYNNEVFSEEHWSRISQYVNTAVRHGINMVLTPIFTPPLDTKVGGERPTVQLVDVEKEGDVYCFCFDKLKRWIDLCRNNGVEYFEFSHLFTQWGAEHAPKIMAFENGEYKRIFGWDTNAAGEDYRCFLGRFLPELINFIKKEGIEDRCFFHVSDEPNINHIESYGKAVDIVRKYLKGFPVMDALSNYEFYEKGLVENPIPANNHIEPFIENNVSNLWTYYCCGQYKEVSNRFFNMPSARNRIIGVQLYKHKIAGFLHWGYNFWYSQYSIRPVNPFCVTDADNAFPSGDAFLVYPGEEGPVESIRLKVFYEALQDLRALEMLEELAGREAVMDILEKGLIEPITFKNYPAGEEWLLYKREEINRKIAEIENSPSRVCS